MKEFKIRCSAIGQIMTDGKAKGTVGKTVDTYLKSWLIEQIYNRRKEFASKYTQKGNIMEDESIDFIGAMLGVDGLIKNEEYFENEFLTGTPDVLPPNIVIDAKNSWDCFTFPYFDTEVPKKDYYWQLQGYMALTGRSAAKLIYVLSDTPMHLIENECKSYCYHNGASFDDEIQSFIDKMTYSDVMPQDKIRIFDIERSDEDIQRIYDRVALCRVLITNLINK